MPRKQTEKLFDIPLAKWRPLMDMPAESVSAGVIRRETGVQPEDATTILHIASLLSGSPETMRMDHLRLVVIVGAVTEKATTAMFLALNRELSEPVIRPPVRYVGPIRGLKDYRTDPVARDIIEHVNLASAPGVGNLTREELRKLFNTIGLANDSLRTDRLTQQLIDDQQTIDGILWRRGISPDAIGRLLAPRLSPVKPTHAEFLQAYGILSHAMKFHVVDHLTRISNALQRPQPAIRKVKKEPDPE
jgi:hypothetical protein